MTEKKKNTQFTILKKETKNEHKGYGAGSISLNNVSPVIIDPTKKEAFVDMGAMHARSRVEKGVKWAANREEVPNGKQYWIVWVAINKNEDGSSYAGLGACELVVDQENKIGYKSMPEQVNSMDKSMKGKIAIDRLDENSKNILKEFLQNHNKDMWDLSSEELKSSLE